MIGRAIFVILLNAIFLVGVLLYLPLDGLLEMRGYDESHIQAMKDARAEDEELEAELAAEEEAKAAAADSVDDEAMEALDPVADDATADEETTEPEAEEPPAREQLVATGTINVRSGPGTDNEQVGQLDAGETVTVLEDNGDDWIRIEFEDGEAWAYRPLFEQP